VVIPGASEEEFELSGSRWAPARAVAAAIVALGLLSSLGWLLHLPWLVQPLVSQPPVRMVSCACLMALGAGLFGMATGRRWLAAAGGLVGLALGGLALAEHAAHRSFGIDGPAVTPWMPDSNLLYASRTPVASAFGFALGALALLTAVLPLPPRIGRFLRGVFGTVLVVLNLALLLGQITGLLEGVQFGLLVGASPQAATGTLLFGATLMLGAWERDLAPAAPPWWLPLAVGLASLVTVVFLWRALVDWEREQATALVAAEARSAQRSATRKLDATGHALWRVARFSAEAPKAGPEWTRYVQSALLPIEGLMGIAWVGGRDHRLILVPAAGDSLALLAQLKAWQGEQPIGRATSGDSLRTVLLSAAEPAFAASAPVCGPAGCDGYVVGVFLAERLLAPVLGDSLAGYHRALVWQHRTLLMTGARPPETRPFTQRTTLRFGGLSWELLVWPSAVTVTRTSSSLPEVVLALGLVVSGLLPLTLQLGRTVAANARQSEQARLSLALGRATDRIWSWEVHGDAASPAMLPQGQAQEVRRGAWVELVHPEDRPRVAQALAAHLAGRAESFEAEYRVEDPSGEWHWRVDRGRVVERGAGGQPRLMLGISGDVTDRRRMEVEREASERRFQAIFDSAYQLQSLLDLECRVLEANPTFLALVRCDSIEQLRGRELWRLPGWGEAAAERIRVACVAAARGGTVREELEYDAGDGSGRRILDFSVKPVLDGQGRVAQLLAEGREITARKRAEAELREVEKLTTMGRLAARVAHEINNPLAGIQNSFLLIRDAISPDHRYYPYVGAIEREIGRIAAVTRQLYETYRPEPGAGGHAGVRVVIADAVAFLEQVNRKTGVRIVADLDGTPAVVPLPDSVLRQSVYNLVQNAVEASPPDGTVTVSARVEDGGLVLRVRDQGPGVAPEARESVFEPFVTTKGRNLSTGGMGIGLSLVRRSVEALGGRIEVLDPPGGGAEFVVRLPLSPANLGDQS
jgi:PAS domain S-box-containing protein